MEFKFNKDRQQKIFQILSKEWEKVFNIDQNAGLEILKRIWDLESMPSTDFRFKTAYEDAIQHIVNNNDWETEYLFLERFNLFKDEQAFKKFIEVLLDPKYYTDDSYFLILTDEVDAELRKGNLKLIIEDYNDSGFPIQTIVPLDAFEDLPKGIKPNKIPFYVRFDSNTKYENEHFKLIPNTGWNDYSIVSIFTLRYYNLENHIETNLGEVKIIHKVDLKTLDTLETKFYELSLDYCALGQEEEYYFNLKDKFGERGIESILYALKDVAYFSEIHDVFERNSNFINSSIRFDNAERILREIKHKLNDREIGFLYNFNYLFKPLYSEEPIEINFNFNDNEPIPSRILAIIGKNGTGKTQLITSLPIALSEVDKVKFQGSIPIFSKIISVSYSVFDNFKIPKKKATFNYMYCGLKDQDGQLRDNKSLLLSFHNNWKRIFTLERGRQWISILNNFIDSAIISDFILEVKIGESPRYSERLDVSIEKFNQARTKLSSGQSIILYIITSIIAHIRFDSLIIYDEPETHLHPNAIVQLMNTIYDLVNEFQSYCLIATHSPLVIRELFSKNVFVLDRVGNIPAFRRIGMESFGENLGTLTSEVFGDKEMPKQYKKIIKNLVNRNLSYQEIVQTLEYDIHPLSLNATLYINSLIKERDEKY